MEKDTSLLLVSSARVLEDESRGYAVSVQAYARHFMADLHGAVSDQRSLNVAARGAVEISGIATLVGLQGVGGWFESSTDGHAHNWVRVRG